MVFKWKCYKYNFISIFRYNQFVCPYCDVHILFVSCNGSTYAKVSLLEKTYHKYANGEFYDLRFTLDEIGKLFVVQAKINTVQYSRKCVRPECWSRVFSIVVR